MQVYKCVLLSSFTMIRNYICLKCLSCGRNTASDPGACHVVCTRLRGCRHRHFGVADVRVDRVGMRNGLLMARDRSRPGYHGYARNDALPG